MINAKVEAQFIGKFEEAIKHDYVFDILEGELEDLGGDFTDIKSTLGDYGYVREGEFLELFIGRMARSNISVGIVINLGSGVTEVGLF